MEDDVDEKVGLGSIPSSANKLSSDALPNEEEGIEETGFTIDFLTGLCLLGSVLLLGKEVVLGDEERGEVLVGKEGA